MERDDPAVESPSSWRGGGIVIDTHIAYFFVPLPDPLWLPDKQVVEVEDETPFDWMAAADAYLPHHTAVSLCFHRVEVTSTVVTPLERALWDLAASALPLRNTGDNSKVERSDESGDADRALGATIVEIAVGFTPADDHDAVASSVISDAFDRGLAACREIQRAYYLARREPVRLVARETLPLGIPHAVRRLANDDGNELPFEVELSLFLTNMNVPASETPWSAKDDATFQAALRHRGARGPFAETMDFLREARVSLYRDGTYRTAVLTTAIACETMLDDLLAMMLWEEEQRPEDGAAVFDSFLVARVKREYSGRLGGGPWSTEGSGVVASWATDVAGLRNRVIHAGYEPTHAEAQRAVEVADELQDFLGDRVASRLKKYPRTAAFMPGRAGLERRKRWTRAWQDFTEDSTQVNWRDTFARWRLAMLKARPDSPLAVLPEPSHAAVSIVVHPDGETVWIAHDAKAGQAAVIQPGDAVDLPPDYERGIAGLCEDARAGAIPRAVSAQFISARATLIPADAWMPEP